MTVGIRAATHDLEGAAELIERAEAIARDRCWERLTATCAALRARMRLPQMIDLDALERRINWTLPLDAHPLAPAARMIQTVAEALIITKLDRNDLAGAARVVKQTLQVTSRSLLESIKIRMLQADLLQRSGRPDEAEAVVGDVIRRTAPHRALRCILDSTSIDVLTGFQETARWAALNDIEKAHLKAIQAARDVGAREVLHQVAARSANLFDLMTEREIDILRELAAGLSNKEIARRVQVTPETVKWHVRNLLRKLDAETRRDAVDKAVAMGLSVTS